MPIDRNVRERHASRHRVRVGSGYRIDPRWRVDLLYFYQMSRDTAGASFGSRDHIIDTLPSCVLSVIEVRAATAEDVHRQRWSVGKSSLDSWRGRGGAGRLEEPT